MQVTLLRAIYFLDVDHSDDKPNSFLGYLWIVNGRECWMRPAWRCHTAVVQKRDFFVRELIISPASSSHVNPNVKEAVQHQHTDTHANTNTELFALQTHENTQLGQGLDLLLLTGTDDMNAKSVKSSCTHTRTHTKHRQLTTIQKVSNDQQCEVKDTVGF